MFKVTALTLVAIFAGVNAQSYNATLAAALQVGWTSQAVPMNSCTADANCTYLTNATYGYSNVCCATWTSTTGAGVVSTLGNACIPQDTDFYTAPFVTAANATVSFNCTINKTWSTYVPATWTAVGQKSCSSNSQCGTGQCCNNNNATYSGLTNSFYEPDNFCMNSTTDKINYNFTSAVAGVSFQVNQMCLSTSNTIAGVVSSTGTGTGTGTTTTTKTGAKALLFSMFAVVMALLSFF